MNDKVTIYMAAHEKFDVPGQEGYVPIQVGAALHDDLGYLRDDAGDNISHRNPNFVELSAFYYMWKNDEDSAYMGLVHYRRFFLMEGNIILDANRVPAMLSDCDIILPEILELESGTVESQYIDQHHKEDMEETRKSIKKIAPEYLPAFEEVMSGNKTYCCNMLIAKSSLVKEYASWLFSILFEVEKNLDVSSYDDYGKRALGFLGERLLTVYVYHHKLKVKELKIGASQEKAETKEYIDKTREMIESGRYEEGYRFMLDVIEKRPDTFLPNSDIHSFLTYQWYILNIRHEEEQSGAISDIWDKGYDTIKLIDSMKMIQDDVSSGAEPEFSVSMGVSHIMVHILCGMLHDSVETEIAVLAKFAECYMKAGNNARAISFANLAMALGKNAGV